jgi:hypothetical protein
MLWPWFAAICGPSRIRQPRLLPWGLSIRPKGSLTRSLMLPVMLPKLAKVESILGRAPTGPLWTSKKEETRWYNVDTEKGTHPLVFLLRTRGVEGIPQEASFALLS